MGGSADDAMDIDDQDSKVNVGLSRLPRAPIGKIIFRASGKVQMKVGDVLFDVSQVPFS